MRARIADIRSASDDEENEETRTAMSVISRTARPEGYREENMGHLSIASTAREEVSSIRARDYYEDMRLGNRRRGHTQGPRRPPVLEEKAPTPKSGAPPVLHARTEAHDCSEKFTGPGREGHVRDETATCHNAHISWDARPLLRAPMASPYQFNDRDGMEPIARCNVMQPAGCLPAMPAGWTGQVPVFGLMSMNNPPGLERARYPALGGATPRQGGVRVGVRPPAATFGADAAKRASEALKLWDILDDPVATCPVPVKEMFAPGVISLAKKGLRFVEALVRKGNFAADRQEQKSHERACRHHGREVLPAEIEFLRAVRKFEPGQKRNVLMLFVW